MGKPRQPTIFPIGAGIRSKNGLFRSGLRTHVFSSPIEVVSGEGESAMEARRCQAATVGSASGESAPAAA